MPKGFGRRYLVTGGAGFLGSHLCERLLDVGNEVLCVDNFYTGTKHNVSHLLTNPNFELLRHDITFALYVEVDAIFNLAAGSDGATDRFGTQETHGASVCCVSCTNARPSILDARSSRDLMGW